MDIKSQLVLDLAELPELSLENPRFNYYCSRIVTNIRKGYDSGEITSKESEIYTIRFRKICAKDLKSTRRVLSEYREYVKVGSNILSVVSLEDILDCRRMCETVMNVFTIPAIKKITSDAALSMCLESLYSKYLDLYNKPQSNELYKVLDLLERTMYSCLHRPATYKRVDEIYREVIETKLELLEKDKEFYYLPAEETKSMANSTNFTKEDHEIINSVKYYSYHRIKYTTKLLLKYFEDYERYRDLVEEVIAEVNKSDLVDSIKDKLDLDLRTYMRGFSAYTYDDVIVKSDELALESLSFYPSKILIDARTVAERFCNSFSKSELVRYFIHYASICQLKMNAVNVGNLNFNSSLLGGLKNLQLYGVISKKELEAVYNKYRRDQ